MAKVGMKSLAAKTGSEVARTAHLEIPAVTIPAIVTRQPDGSVLVRAGKPVVSSDTIGAKAAGKLLGLSVRTIEKMCLESLIPGATKPGSRPKSRWRIPLQAVLNIKNRQPDV
jgi:hypothetical protein